MPSVRSCAFTFSSDCCILAFDGFRREAILHQTRLLHGTGARYAKLKAAGWHLSQHHAGLTAFADFCSAPIPRHKHGRSCRLQNAPASVEAQAQAEAPLAPVEQKPSRYISSAPQCSMTCIFNSSIVVSSLASEVRECKHIRSAYIGGCSKP